MESGEEARSDESGEYAVDTTGLSYERVMRALPVTMRPTGVGLPPSPREEGECSDSDSEEVSEPEWQSMDAKHFRITFQRHTFRPNCCLTQTS